MEFVAGLLITVFFLPVAIVLGLGLLLLLLVIIAKIIKRGKQ